MTLLGALTLVLPALALGAKLVQFVLNLPAAAWLDRTVAAAMFIFFAIFDLRTLANVSGTMEEAQYQRPERCDSEENNAPSKRGLSDDEFDALLAKQIDYSRTRAGAEPDFSFRKLTPDQSNKLRPSPDGPVKPGSRPPFEGARLAHVELSELDLHDIDFRGANLTCANFTGAKLNGAIFDNARLEGALFLDVKNAEKAEFNHVRAAGADFSGANLAGSSFDRAASLAGANFAGAKVDNASFSDANLTDALWSPLSAPPASRIADATGLETLRPVPDGKSETPSLSGLKLLARELKKGGETHAMDMVTHAYEAAETRRMWAEGDVSFDGALTLARALWRRFTWGALTDYGLSPLRALIAFFFLAVTFTPFYWVAIPADGSRSPWLFRVWPKDALDRHGALRADAEAVGFRAGPSGRRIERAIAASCESTLNVGFGEIKLAEWLQRLRKVEKETSALGWLRVVAGVQSLMATVIFILWVWCLLGDPFGDAGAG